MNWKCIVLVLSAIHCAACTTPHKKSASVQSHISTLPVRKDTSQHLFLLALQPNQAFTTDAEREALWSALRGEHFETKPLLGRLEQIPMNYRVEYVFNHTTPRNEEAKFHTFKSWLKDMPKRTLKRLESAKTLLLVKGTLPRLAEAQELRLTLAALVFLAERYEGIVFDLLNRKAYDAPSLRWRLENETGLIDQVKFRTASVNQRRGLRTVGLPKYGWPDIFLATTRTREGLDTLRAIVDIFLRSPKDIERSRFKSCGDEVFDYGCVELIPAR